MRDGIECGRVRCTNEAVTLKALAPALAEMPLCEKCVRQLRQRGTLETSTDNGGDTDR